MNFRIPTKSKDLVQHFNGEIHPLLNKICKREKYPGGEEEERRRRGEEEKENPNTKASLLYQEKL